jgi:cytochrome c biogenesis protein CcdA
MIELIIYHIHIVAILAAFTIRWQREGVKAGLLAVALCGLAFTIVWALMGPLARLLMGDAGQTDDLFTSDTLSLLFTAGAEIPLYWAIFFRPALAQNPPTL